MRKTLISSLVVAAAAALAVAATATGARTTGAAQAAIPGCAKGSLNLVEDGVLTIGADNPAFPPWFGGAEKTKPWKVSDPYSGKGYESAVSYAVARQLGFTKAQVKWTVVPFNELVPPGQEAVRLLHHPGLVHAGAREGGRLLEVVLLRQPVGRRPQGHADREGQVDRRAEAVQARRAGGDDELHVHQRSTSSPSSSPLVFDTNDAAVQALKNGQIDGIVVDLPTAFYVTAVQVDDGVIVGKLPTKGTKERFGMVFQKGNTLRACVNKALDRLWRDGTIKKLQTTYLARAGAPDIT